MAASGSWKIIGQVGTITKLEQKWIISIAENRYSNDVKTSTIWYTCISNIEPKVKKGDRVIADGTFEPSINKDFPYAMIIKHIGLLKEGK